MSVKDETVRKSVSAHTVAASLSVMSKALTTVTRSRACLGDVAQRTMTSVDRTRGIRRYVTLYARIRSTVITTDSLL